jgi:UDP-glucose 4-epimerase
MLKRVLVTGSKGFVGSHLVERLLADGHALTLADRSADGAVSHRSLVTRIAVGDIGPDTDWRTALDGCDTVVHLAGQTSSDRDGLCERVNDLGTKRLAAQALETGARAFVLLSSIMAIVDNVAERPISDAAPSRATSAYGRSKLRAEAHVAAFAAAGGAGISLRPPAVYGPGAKGNLARLRTLANSPLPLPFGATRNRRTLISAGNLVDAIATAIRRGASARSGAYAVSDAETLSTADIVRHLRAGRDRPPRLVPVPPVLMRWPLQLAGLGSVADSLLGDLEIDASRFTQLFDWRPLEATPDALAAWSRAGSV